MCNSHPHAIEILDCTLRDGGRLIDCAFRDGQTRGIVERLMQANIDIIEVGVLREKAVYTGDSTFFHRIEEAEALLPEGSGQSFALFIDYGYYPAEGLPPCSGEFKWGIRYGFTKKDFLENREALKQEMLLIKEKGYRLYLQCVNTRGYSAAELLDLIALANEVLPYSFGIVDTYGSMYQDDLDRIFSLVDFSLSGLTAIDFHGHNNMQMAFALAQRCVKLCQGRRKLILDATLEGMGKCAGNLATELAAHYLNQKQGGGYEFDRLLDAADEFIDVFRKDYPWGYTLPAFMAGIYQAHPNNVIYLTDKYRLSSKDIRKILSLIDEAKRQRYDYDNIRKIYRSYFDAPEDDTQTLRELKAMLGGRTVLILAAGTSIAAYPERIRDYMQKHHAEAVSINFMDPRCPYAFFGNDRRYQEPGLNPEGKTVVLTSNVTRRTGRELVVNYTDCIAASGNYFDNSTLMLLNLLESCGVSRIGIAGMDGFECRGANYFDKPDTGKRLFEQFDAINRELEWQLSRYVERNKGRIRVEFVTPSRFAAEGWEARFDSREERT